MQTLQKTGQNPYRRFVCILPLYGNMLFWPVFCNVGISTTPQIDVTFFLGLSEVMRHFQQKFKLS